MASDGIEERTRLEPVEQHDGAAVLVEAEHVVAGHVAERERECEHLVRCDRSSDRPRVEGRQHRGVAQERSLGRSGRAGGEEQPRHVIAARRGWLLGQLVDAISEVVNGQAGRDR